MNLDEYGPEIRPPAAPYDPTRRDWAVITQAHGGTTSILRNLTLHQAVETYKRLKPQWMRGSGMYHLNAGTIVDISIIGPEGWR